MKTPAIAHEKKSPTMDAAKTAMVKFKKLSKTTTAKAQTLRKEATSGPVRLLSERSASRAKGRVRLGLYAPEAQAVFVAGSFNDWQPFDFPLQKQADGRWAAELLIEPGRHEYRFVVDGEWTDDPMSPAFVSNPFGGLNSVLVVTLLS